MKTATALVMTIVTVGYSHAARAQRVNSSTPQLGAMFDRKRTIVVADRMVPGYQRSGVRVGAFTVKPEATVGLALVDNLYGSETDTVSALAATIEPRVAVALAEGRGRLDLLGDVQVNRFFSRSTENNTQFSTRATGQYDLGGGLRANLSGDYARQMQRRSDPGAITGSIEPILFYIADANVELVWERGSLRVRGGGSYNDFDFRAGRLANGTLLPQDYRDRHLARGEGEVAYALTPDLALRLEGSYARNDYRRTTLTAFNRSSRRIELLGGTSFEFTDLLRGEVAIGYLNLKYDTLGLKNFSGVGGRVQVEYLPTRLTTVTFRLSRTIEEAGQPQTPSYVRTTCSLTVDHELYRNVILSASAVYSRNRFRDPERTDRRPTFGAAGRYLLSDRISVIARYDYLHASTRPAPLGRQITLNTASVGLNVGL